MTSLVAIYRGGSSDELELVAATTDPNVIADVSARMLREEEFQRDPVLRPIAAGRREALRLIHLETSPTKARL